MRNKNGILFKNTPIILLKASIKIIRHFLSSILVAENHAKSILLKLNRSFSLDLKKLLFFAIFHKKIRGKISEKLS